MACWGAASVGSKEPVGGPGVRNGVARGRGRLSVHTVTCGRKRAARRGQRMRHGRLFTTERAYLCTYTKQKVLRSSRHSTRSIIWSSSVLCFSGASLVFLRKY